MCPKKKVLIEKKHYQNLVLWSQIFPSKCLGSAWSCETKQAKKHFPGSRDACYWWLNRCSVAPAAFCTFFGTPCILLVPFSRTPCICLLTKKCEITCIFFVSYWQLENCQMAFITSKTEPSHWVLKVWQHFRQTVFPQKRPKLDTCHCNDISSFGNTNRNRFWPEHHSQPKISSTSLC